MKLNKLFLLPLLLLSLQVATAQETLSRRYQNLKISRVKDSLGKIRALKIDFDIDPKTVSDLQIPY